MWVKGDKPNHLSYKGYSMDTKENLHDKEKSIQPSTHTPSRTPSRNEACPCGSGKKYKRCCGVSAMPKLSTPKSSSGFGDAQGTQSQGQTQEQMDALKNMDPQALMQVSQALQKLPKGQMQRLQSLMQKAMSGKDITSEAAEFEKTLPLDFQNLIHSMGGPGMSDLSDLSAGPLASLGSQAEMPELTEDLTIEKARALIEKAAAEGAISKEEAASLLAGQSDQSGAEGSTEAFEGKIDPKSSFGKFWRNLSGKKE